MAIELVKKQANLTLSKPTTGGGGGAVSSVNGKIGAVVLTAKDVGAATLKDIEDAKEIYVGTGEAPEGVDLQIDLSGEPFDIEAYIDTAITNALEVVENGSY